MCVSVYLVECLSDCQECVQNVEHVDHLDLSVFELRTKATKQSVCRCTPHSINLQFFFWFCKITIYSSHLLCIWYAFNFELLIFTGFDWSAIVVTGLVQLFISKDITFSTTSASYFFGDISNCSECGWCFQYLELGSKFTTRIQVYY